MGRWLRYPDDSILHGHTTCCGRARVHDGVGAASWAARAKGDLPQILCSLMNHLTHLHGFHFVYKAYMLVALEMITLTCVAHRTMACADMKEALPEAQMRNIVRRVVMVTSQRMILMSGLRMLDVMTAIAFLGEQQNKEMHKAGLSARS